MLDAFYIGRAVAQTISERLGAVLGDVLSEVVKLSAEQQRAIRFGRKPCCSLTLARSSTHCSLYCTPALCEHGVLVFAEIFRMK